MVTQVAKYLIMLPGLVLLSGCPDIGDAPGDATEAPRCVPSEYVLYCPDNDTDGQGSEPVDGSCDLRCPYDPDDTPAPGTVKGNDDCNDADSTTYFGAKELCDGKDNDCDGAVDEDIPQGDKPTYNIDEDGDGYGDTHIVFPSCTDPEGFVPTGGEHDCDDRDPNIYPGAPEIAGDDVDQDCDGVDVPAMTPTPIPAPTPTPAPQDYDGDGYIGTDDCDEHNADVYPGADELCDGQDSDCDGVADEDAVDAVKYYPDTDDDGQGDSASMATASCEPVDGMVTNTLDCDDDDPLTYTGATEECADEDDRNCDGSVSYADADADGYHACEECNDADASVNPGVEEVCDGIDQNCNGSADEGLDTQEYCEDADGDGYSSENCEIACELPGDTYVPVSEQEAGQDCDDADASVNPGVDEQCDNVDHDCDGSAYNNVDDDHDGYCEGSGSQADCGDDDPDIFPGANEACDAKDNDCDGIVDNGFDRDDDGYYSASECAYGDDCDDTNDRQYPGATEVCNGEDDNCDGVNDETDGDGDGYYQCGSRGDCDDTNANVNPAATEICDGADNNCSGTVDEGFDGDRDGHASSALCPGVESADDCNDQDASVHPGATETCYDQIDKDCDGEKNPIGAFDDADDDGETICDGDCDDNDPQTYPGADEICQDGKDNDCDGSKDEFPGCVQLHPGRIRDRLESKPTP